MPEAENPATDAPVLNGHKDTNRGTSHKLSSSPQLPFPSMHQSVSGQQPSPGSAPTGRHSHVRSRSVNLSPTISAAGTSFSPGALRWDGFASDPSSSSSSSLHTPPYLAPAAPIGSPHLRPSSPLYVNIQSASPSHLELWRNSPGNAGSESGSSEGSSPDHRSRSHFSRAMERSSSAGGLGSTSGAHLAPNSPRSSFKRAASPSRTYAVPLSPRLQAFGGRTHARKLSGGASSHLGEPLLRSTSPLAAATNLEPELPIDSVWPGNSDSTLPPSSPRSEAIPIGLNNSQTTPIPPSLRDDLLGSVDDYATSSSPAALRPLSSSPQDHFSSFRLQRTPSPSIGAGGSRREKRISGSSPSTSSPMTKARPHSSPSLPALAAPRPITKKPAFSLDGTQGSQSLHMESPRRHMRGLSNTSAGSQGEMSDTESVEEISLLSGDESSPAQKVLSPPAGAQAKLDTQNALAEVLSHDRPREKEGHEETNIEGEGGERSESADANSAPPSMNSFDSTRAVASAHNIAWNAGSSSLGFSSSLGRRKSLLGFNGRAIVAPDGTVLRAKSPALSSPKKEAIPLGESPPKTRSFIGMPPRSGYELSDDPDDVGSEDGSTGSGRESIHEDRDEDDGIDDGDEFESEGDELDDGMDDIGKDGLDGADMTEDTAQPKLARPSPAPRRPSLGRQTAVLPPPLSSDSEEAAIEENSEGMQWKEEAEEVLAVPHRRADLQLTRDEGSDGDEGSNEDEDGEDGQGETGEEGQNLDFIAGQDSSVDESLNTLERIFLFAKSEMTYHRVLVSHSLADWILEVELSDAVEYVVPLLNGLACDENEVCFAFAPHLHKVMWYFFRNCPLVEDTTEEVDSKEQTATEEQMQSGSDDSERASRPRISVGIFTPLLCALLLNYDAAIANATQTAIVRFFAHLQGFDFSDAIANDQGSVPEEEQVSTQPSQFSSGKAQAKERFDEDTALIRDAAAREEKRVALDDYDFGEGARQRIVNELLHHVALAIGHLNLEQTTQARDMTGPSPTQANGGEEQEHQGPRDLPDEVAHADAEMDDIPLSIDDEAQAQRDASVMPRVQVDQEEGDDTEMTEKQDELDDGMQDNHSAVMSDVEEEVAVGRMASVSLLAALGAEEVVSKEFLLDFIVPEMQRFSNDRTFFVRKEVAVALGALAKCIGYEGFQQADLMSNFTSFCRDRIWHVRQAACLSMPNVFNQVRDAEVKRSKSVEIMRIFVGDVSRNVRVAALDVIGEMIYLFHDDPQGVPPELVRHFLGEAYDVESTESQGLQSKRSSKASMDNSAAMDESALSNSFSDIESPSPDFSGDTRAQHDSSWGGIPRSISTIDASQGNGWSNSNHHNNSFSMNSYQGHINGVNLLDPDRPLVMAYNFPAVMLTLGAAYWPKLKPVHAQLCSNPSSKVRRSLAASLHELAKIIGTEASTSDLHEIFQRFVGGQGEGDEQVKMAILENLDVFLEHLALPKALESLRYLSVLWSEDSQGDPSRFSSNWRLREKLISLIPSLAKRYLLLDNDGVLVVLMQSAIVDGVSSVRWQGTQVVSSLYHILEESDQVLADGFLGMLVDVGENESYRGRVACIQCLTELCKQSLQRSSVEMLILDRLATLSKDAVVDVRLAVSQLAALLCSRSELYAAPQSRSTELVAILQRLCHDESSLVRDVIRSILSDEDEGRKTPQLSTEEMEDRPARILILGPSGGGPHRPTKADSTYGLNGSQDGSNPFTMEPEEDTEERLEPSSSASRLDSFLSSGNGATMPDRAKLLHRRLLQNSRHQRTGDMLLADEDSSMFEDADDDYDEVGDGERGDEENQDGEEEEKDEFRRGGQRMGAGGMSPRGQGLANGFPSDLYNEDEVIVIPSHDNFLMLSSSSSNDGSSNHSKGPGDVESSDSLVGDDSLEEEPHHLLGVVHDSPHRILGKRAPESSPEQSRHAGAAQSLFLESPERPWFSSTEGSNESQPTYAAAAGGRQKSFNGARKTSADPFLAFVADKRFDHTSAGGKVGGEKDHGEEEEALSSPSTIKKELQ